MTKGKVVTINQHNLVINIPLKTKEDLKKEVFILLHAVFNGAI